jgi:hypothetical protein
MHMNHALVRTRIPTRLSEISTLQLVGSGLGHVGKRRVLARQPFFRVQLAQVLHNGSTRGVPRELRSKDGGSRG